MDRLIDDVSGSPQEQAVALARLKDYVALHHVEKADFLTLLERLSPVAKDLDAKVASAALQVLHTLVAHNGQHVRSQLGTLTAIAVDRSGDSKALVRAAATALLRELLDAETLPPVLEGLDRAFSHKNARVRECACAALAGHVREAGLVDTPQSVLEGALVPRLAAAAAADAAAPAARAAALDALAALHAHLPPGALQAMLRERGYGDEQLAELQAHIEGGVARPVSPASAATSSRPQTPSAPRRGAASSRLGTGASIAATVTEDTVAVVAIGSEGELISELNAIRSKLDANKEWDVRIGALKRLQGVAQGGAGGHAAFAEQLKSNLRDSLRNQLCDRRSQVCRAACSAVAACAEATGRRFEPVALSVFPELFRILVGSIAVMTEAADACVTRVVAAVPAPRVAARLVDTMLRDRNSKLRQHVARYLLLVLREWPPGAYEAQAAQFREAVKKAVGDTSPDTRATGRRLLCHFVHLHPAAREPLLRSLDRSVQVKMRAALDAFDPAEGDAPVATAPVATSLAPQAMPARVGAAARGVSRPGQLLTEGSEAGSARGAGQASPVRGAAARLHTTYAQPVASAGFASDHGLSSSGQQPPGLRAVVDRYDDACAERAAPPTWLEHERHLEACAAAVAALDGGDGRAELHRARPRLQPLILAAFAHTHKRVKAAALHLVQACLRLDGAAFEGAAADVLPPLLELTATQPAAVATGAQAAVAAMAARLPADALAHALLAATESKSWHVKLHAFEAFSEHLSPAAPAGAPHDTRTTARMLAAALACFSVHGQAVELRRAAVDVVCTIHDYSPELVVREVHSVAGPGTGQTDLMRALSEARPSIETAVNAFRHSLTSDAAEHRALHPAHAPAAPRQGGGARAPLQSIHNQPASADGGGGAWGSDDAAGARGGGGAKARMERLLDVINQQPGDCTDALRRLTAAVAAVPRATWEAKGAAVVATAAQLLELSYYDALPATCDLLKALAAAHAPLLEARLPLAVGALLATYNTLPVVEGAALVQHVESTLDTFANALDAHALMQYYISVFPSAASVERGTAIDRKNMLRRLCQMARITIMRCKHDAALERDVLGLVPGIHTTLDTSCPGVRMRGTEAWVAAFSVLGPRLRPYMENLTQTQQRLVNLYFKRIRPASMAESVAALSAPQ